MDVNAQKSEIITNFFDFINMTQGDGVNVLPYIRFHVGGEIIHDDVLAVYFNENFEVKVVSCVSPSRKILTTLFTLDEHRDKSFDEVLESLKKNVCSIFKLQFLLKSKIIKNSNIVQTFIQNNGHNIALLNSPCCESHIFGFIKAYDEHAEDCIGLMPLFFFNFAGIINPCVHGIFLTKDFNLKIFLVEEEGNMWKSIIGIIDLKLNKSIPEELFVENSKLDQLLNFLECNIKKILNKDDLLCMKILSGNLRKVVDFTDTNAQLNSQLTNLSAIQSLAMDVISMAIQNAKLSILRVNIEVMHHLEIYDLWDLVGFVACIGDWSDHDEKWEEKVKSIISATLNSFTPTTISIINVFLHNDSHDISHLEKLIAISAFVQERIYDAAYSDWKRKQAIIYS